MVGMRFNTIGVSDGISMGTNGDGHRHLDTHIHRRTHKHAHAHRHTHTQTFNTYTGMSYSLPSRDIIADSIETVSHTHTHKHTHTHIRAHTDKHILTRTLTTNIRLHFITIGDERAVVRC